MNVSRILDRLYLGSAPETVADLQYLFDCGVTDIIDCRIEASDQPLIAQFTETFELLNDGVLDWTPDAAIGKQPLPKSFFARADTYWTPHIFTMTPYVHCSLGMNRSVTLVYFFLRVLGLSETDAIELINKHRIETLPWFDLMDSPWRNDAENALKQLGYIS